MHCDVRNQLEYKLKDADHQLTLADREAKQAPSRHHSAELLVEKASEVKSGLEAALHRHIAQCPACQAN